MGGVLGDFSGVPAEELASRSQTHKPTARKRTEPAGKRAGRTLKMVLGVLAVLILTAGGFGYGYYHSKISLLQHDDGSTTVDGAIDETDVETLDRAEEMESAVAGLAITDPVFVGSDVDKFGGSPFDSKIVNILLLGTDERSEGFSDAARSDTIIICSVNLDTGAIRLVSVERGMGAPVLEGRYKGEWDWISHIFRYGGANLMMKTVSSCFDLDVRYYVRVNFNTFIKFVDALGGVDITLTKREADGLNTNIVAYNQDLCDWVQEGDNHMNGFLALQYARMRKIDSDWARTVRQRNTIAAILAKAKTLSVGELDDVLDTVLPLIKTNLSEQEITLLLFKIPLFLEAMDIQGITVPVDGTYGSMTGMGGRALFAADFTKNAAIIHEIIYGSEEEAGDATEG